MSEKWLPIAGYIGVYEVSSLGRVRSLTRIVMGKWPRRIPTKILRLTKHNKGYRCVTLYRDGKPDKQLVHHLVLEAFVGPRPSDKEGCHGDRDRAHNDVGNLRWGTRSDNVRDALRHGTHYNAAKLSCKYEHLFESPNLKIRESNGQRVCVTCESVKGAVQSARAAGRAYDRDALRMEHYQRVMRSA